MGAGGASGAVGSGGAGTGGAQGSGGTGGGGGSGGSPFPNGLEIFTFLHAGTAFSNNSTTPFIVMPSQVNNLPISAVTFASVSSAAASLLIVADGSDGKHVFNFLYNASQFQTPAFSTTVITPAMVGSMPINQIAFADMTGKGVEDLLVVTTPANGGVEVIIFPNQGAGTFSTNPTSFTLNPGLISNQQISQLAFVDVTGDNKVDLVVVSYPVNGGALIYTFPGTGTSFQTLQPVTSFMLTAGAVNLSTITQIAFGDVVSSGSGADLMVLASGNMIFGFDGLGSGKFSANPSFTIGTAQLGSTPITRVTAAGPGPSQAGPTYLVAVGAASGNTIVQVFPSPTISPTRYTLMPSQINNMPIAQLALAPVSGSGSDLLVVTAR
jgi:hypothetical protein